MADGPTSLQAASLQAGIAVEQAAGGFALRPCATEGRWDLVGDTSWK